MLGKIRGDFYLFIDNTYGLVCVKIGVHLCKKTKIIVVVRASVTGYQDLDNRLHRLKMALEVS